MRCLRIAVYHCLRRRIGRANLPLMENLMPDRPWQAVVLVLCLLGGCSANYVFDDAAYRPLGEPQATTRGQ